MSDMVWKINMGLQDNTAAALPVGQFRFYLSPGGGAGVLVLVYSSKTSRWPTGNLGGGACMLGCLAAVVLLGFGCVTPLYVLNVIQQKQLLGLLCPTAVPYINLLFFYHPLQKGFYPQFDMPYGTCRTTG